MHFRINWPQPKTTTDQSRQQTTNQQPLFTSESAKGCRPAHIGHSIAAQILILYTMVKQKTTEDADFRTQKGCLSV